MLMEDKTFYEWFPPAPSVDWKGFNVYLIIPLIVATGYIGLVEKGDQ